MARIRSRLYCSGRPLSSPTFGVCLMPPAARSVFARRHAIVIGPTPPVTGVTARAWPISAIATSPPDPGAPRRITNAIDADVDHDSPRLDPVAAHQAGASRRDDEGYLPRLRSPAARVSEYAQRSRCIPAPRVAGPWACRRSLTCRSRRHSDRDNRRSPYPAASCSPGVYTGRALLSRSTGARH